MATETVRVDFGEQPEEVAWQISKLLRRLGHDVRIAQKGDPNGITFEIVRPEPIHVSVWYDETPVEVVDKFARLLGPYGVKITDATADDRFGVEYTITQESLPCEPQS